MIVHSKTVAGRAAALFAVVLILSMTTNAEADRVTFENGDRISGQIIHVIGGEIQIITDYAGTVTAAFDRVADMRADNSDFRDRNSHLLSIRRFCVIVAAWHGRGERIWQGIERQAG